MTDKIRKAKELIEHGKEKAPALMCSFGKDSMVLLHLMRQVIVPQVPILFYRHPWFPAKWEFANYVIQSWGLEVHDYPPVAAGIKVKDDSLELVARYNLGNGGALDLPINTLEPHPRRQFVCGLNDWVLRPKCGLHSFPWETVFMGHKSSDVDPFEGPVPLEVDQTEVGGVQLVFPLRDWTDADVWDYIEENHVPYDRRRYQDRAELADKWLNSDYIHACTRCMDPREGKEIFCPKTGKQIPNVSAQVLRLQERPDYIGREAAAA